MRANSCLRMFGDACAFRDWFLPGFKAKTTLTEPSQDWWSQGVILSLLHMKVLGLSTCACTPEIRPFSGMIPLINHDPRLRSHWGPYNQNIGEIWWNHHSPTKNSPVTQQVHTSHPSDLAFRTAKKAKVSVTARLCTMGMGSMVGINQSLGRDLTTKNCCLTMFNQ